MKKQESNREVYRHLGLATHLGMTLLVSLLLGVFLGIYVDNYFETVPLFTIGMGFFGIFSGLWNVIKMFSGADEKDGIGK